jgi:hypothetical protein
MALFSSSGNAILGIGKGLAALRCRGVTFSGTRLVELLSNKTAGRVGGAMNTISKLFDGGCIDNARASPKAAKK